MPGIYIEYLHHVRYRSLMIPEHLHRPTPFKAFVLFERDRFVCKEKSSSCCDIFTRFLETFLDETLIAHGNFWLSHLFERWGEFQQPPSTPSQIAHAFWGPIYFKRRGYHITQPQDQNRSMSPIPGTHVPDRSQGCTGGRESRVWKAGTAIHTWEKMVVEVVSFVVTNQ